MDKPKLNLSLKRALEFYLKFSSMDDSFKKIISNMFDSFLKLLIETITLMEDLSSKK